MPNLQHIVAEELIPSFPPSPSETVTSITLYIDLGIESINSNVLRNFLASFPNLSMLEVNTFMYTYEELPVFIPTMDLVLPKLASLTLEVAVPDAISAVVCGLHMPMLKTFHLKVQS